jgi:hypothetical protein
MLTDEWQPIETAKHGHCLFFGATRHDTYLRFTGWVAVNGLCYTDSGDLCRPTHWMPLPPPPMEQTNAD